MGTSRDICKIPVFVVVLVSFGLRGVERVGASTHGFGPRSKRFWNKSLTSTTLCFPR